MKPVTRSFYEQAVQRAVERVVAGLDDALDLEELARGAALSPFHFHRIFRGMLGETPLQMHRRLRLERAARRLVEDGAPVTAVAFDAGYDTHEAFTRAFRAHFGHSPSEFRAEFPAGLCIGPPVRLSTRSGVHYDPDPGAALRIQFPTGDSEMDVHIEQLPDFRVASVRHVGPYPRIAEAFAKLGELAMGAGLFTPGTFMLGMYHDDPETTPEAELRSDAAISVADDVDLPEGLVRQRVGGGRYARYTHIGPYEGLPNAWGRFMGEWLPQSGERVREAAPLEIYRNDPGRVKPEELHTDLYIALE